MSHFKKTIVRFAGISLVMFLTAGSVLRYSSPSEPDRKFSGTEEHQITMETALRYVSNYHTSPGEQLSAAYMSRTIFEKILAQDQTVGVRIYNARLDDGRPTYVIVGVDKHGNDLISGVIGEDVVPCPPYCGDVTMLPRLLSTR